MRESWDSDSSYFQKGDGRIVPGRIAITVIVRKRTWVREETNSEKMECSGRGTNIWHGASKTIHQNGRVQLCHTPDQRNLISCVLRDCFGMLTTTTRKRSLLSNRAVHARLMIWIASSAQLWTSFLTREYIQGLSGVLNKAVDFDGTLAIAQESFVPRT